MRKMVFLLALALGLHLQAQELDVCTKPYGEEQEIVVIKPTVANFLTLLSLTEEQFQNVMEDNSYINQEWGGRFLAYWNGSHENFSQAKCVNAFLYNRAENEVHFVVGREMIYPQGSIISLVRDLRPYFKGVEPAEQGGHRVEVYELKNETDVYKFKLHRNPQFFYFIVTRQSASAE